MKCMYCDCMESKVIDTRPTDEGTVIRRRRDCEGCGRRFTTAEKVEHVARLVVKRAGRRESFDSEKIRGGIIKACEKRPVSMDEIDAMVSDIEREVYNSLIKEISSARIGDLVMEKLRGKDDVAYVRFASVYKQFKDIDEFMDELRDLVKERSS